MRFHWIVFILSILVSMGLVVIVMGQNQVLIILKKGSEKLQMESERLENQRIDEDLFKMAVEKLLAQGKGVVEDLEATVAKLGPEIEKKKTENDACQAEKKTKADELAGSEKEHTETEATLKAESEAWNQEINTLKAQLTGYRPVCDHVKPGPLIAKLCGTKPAEPLL